MKKIIWIMIMGCWIYDVTANTNEWMALQEQVLRVDEYIQTTRMRRADTIADNIKGYLDKQPTYIDLQNMMKESWPFALAHLEQIATNDVQKTVVIMAGREISEDEYIDFLEQLLDMTERGALDAQILKFATVVTTGSRRNFHAKYDPRIQAAVERVRELYAGPW